jgi:hypothetical protein
LSSCDFALEYGFVLGRVCGFWGLGKKGHGFLMVLLALGRNRHTRQQQKNVT